MSVDVWAVLAERVDWSLRRPKLADDIEFGPVEDTRGDPYVMVANPRDLLHLRMTAPEVDLMGLMDGSRTVGELVIDQLEAGGDLDLAGVVDLVASLEGAGFLEDDTVDVDAALNKALFPVTFRSRVNQAISTLGVEWSQAEGMVRFLYQYGLRFVFTRSRYRPRVRSSASSASWRLSTSPIAAPTT